MSEDPEWAKAAGITPVDDGKNIEIMLRIYREIGERYGKRVGGWFVDGGDAYYWRNFSFKQLELALKAGNRDRIATFFAWLFQNSHPTVEISCPISPILVRNCRALCLQHGSRKAVLMKVCSRSKA